MGTALDIGHFRDNEDTGSTIQDTGGSCKLTTASCHFLLNHEGHEGWDTNNMEKGTKCRGNPLWLPYVGQTGACPYVFTLDRQLWSLFFLYPAQPLNPVNFLLNHEGHEGECTKSTKKNVPTTQITKGTGIKEGRAFTRPSCKPSQSRTHD